MSKNSQESQDALLPLVCASAVSALREIMLGNRMVAVQRGTREKRITVIYLLVITSYLSFLSPLMIY